MGTRTQLEIAASHAITLFHEGTEGLLLTFYAKTNLDTVSPRLSKVFEERVVHNLWAMRGRRSPLQVMTERDSGPYSWNGPVLMVYPNAKMLNRVADIGDVTAEIVVPWIGNKDIVDWTAAWSPQRLGAAIASPTIEPPSPAVIAALRWLSSFVNTNNGLSTKTDRDETIQVFETLLAYDKLEIRSVKAWLMTEGRWPGEIADEACAIIQDLIAGKRLHGCGGPDRSRYDRWLAEVDE